MAAVDDVDRLIERYHVALGEFVKGDPEPVKELFSHKDDVTLANPLGPPARGGDEVAKTIEHAATTIRDGEITGFEIVSKLVTHELAYVLEIERQEAKVGGNDDATPFALRVTMIIRPEDGEWKVVHRHADPITTAHPHTLRWSTSILVVLGGLVKSTVLCWRAVGGTLGLIHGFWTGNRVTARLVVALVDKGGPLVLEPVSVGRVRSDRHEHHRVAAT
jgi:ketosteroid isomerase-like protein